VVASPGVKSPALLAHELAEARRLLGERPESGQRFEQRGGVWIYRLLLPKTKRHLYYEIDAVAGEVIVHVVWGAPRGTPPEL
jgi:hypothetical protein